MSNAGAHQKPPRITYPWLSSTSLLFLLAYFVLLHYEARFATLSNLPDWCKSPVFQAAVALAVVVTLISDVQQFLWQKKQQKHYYASLENELKELWGNRKSLQQRSLAYAGQTEKLKQFISDKLVEYLEYDEKFLHFKNIASEVRHNGVISYDIIKSALDAYNNETTQNITPGDLELGSTHRFGLPNNPLPKSQQALDALNYLWDLLDLSTADNIAQHIGDNLIECEESYFQYALAGEDSIPGNRPFYSPALAMAKTLGPFMEPLEHNALIDKVTRHSRDKLQFSSAQFSITLDCGLHLLGNPNHFILLLENLIKNALFFCGKAAFKQKSDRVAITLKELTGCLFLSVYNRGPTIRKNRLENIFQLGFSTRKTNEHHGKGLGMFFVKEIVQGYTGDIQVVNVFNQNRQFELSVRSEDGETYHELITIDYDDKRPRLVSADRPEPLSQLQIDFSSALLRINIELPELKLKHSFEHLDEEGCTIVDDLDPHKPIWRIDIKRKRNAYRLTFTPLDIQGVEFQVKLPSAESHLDGSTPSFEDSFEEDVRQLTEKLPRLNDL